MKPGQLISATLLSGLLLGLLVLSLPQHATALTRDVDLNDTLTFVPTTIQVEPGEAVNLRLVNGQNVHTFTLFKEADADVPFSNQPDLNAYYSTAQKIVDITLQSGDVKWANFTAPMTEGRYIFVCMEPGHSPAGMHGELIVGSPPEGGITPSTIGIVAAVVIVAVVIVVFFLLKRTRE